MPIVTNPPTVRIRPKELVDCAQIADTLVFPGQDRRVIYDQIRGFLKDGYLWPVAREEGGKKAFLMQPDHILIAEVLLRLREFGAHRKDDQKGGPYHAAAFALRQWVGDKPEGAKQSPAAHVIAEYEVDARGWVFELWCFLHPTSGKVHYEGRIHNVSRMQATDLRAPLRPQWEARGCFAVDLTDLLDRVHPRGKARRGAMN